MKELKILNIIYEKVLRVISVSVLSAILLSFNSCITYYDENMTPQQFEKLEEPEKEILLELTTKDSVITAEEYSIGYAKTQSLFYVEKMDSLLKVNTNPVVYKKVKTTSKISLNDVLKITTAKSEFDMGKTLKWTGITMGSLLLIGIILLAIFPPTVEISMNLH